MPTEEKPTEAMNTEAMPTAVVANGNASYNVQQADVSNALRAHGTTSFHFPQADVSNALRAHGTTSLNVPQADVSNALRTTSHHPAWWNEHSMYCVYWTRWKSSVAVTNGTRRACSTGWVTCGFERKLCLLALPTRAFDGGAIFSR